MNPIEKQKYHKKLNEINRHLHESISGLGRIILSNILDLTLLIVLIVIPGVWNLLEGEMVSLIIWLLIFASMIFSLILTLITGGISPGKFITDIRFASTKTLRKIRREDYSSYISSKIWLGLKYENIYETFRFITSEKSQNLAMEENDMVLVPRRRLKELERLKEELNFQLQKEAFADDIFDLQDSKILSGNHSTIFKDE